jgi:hypothetical protein
MLSTLWVRKLAAFLHLLSLPEMSSFLFPLSWRERVALLRRVRSGRDKSEDAGC